MKITGFIIPLLVAVFALAAAPLKEAFNFPTAQQTFVAPIAPQATAPNATPAPVTASQEATLFVNGVKCKGTADFFMERFKNAAGIETMTAFAADHKVVIGFNPAAVSLAKIIELAEAPVRGDDGEYYTFFKVMESSVKTAGTESGS